MTADGRISIAGLNTGNLEYIADAFHKGPQEFTTENALKVKEILDTIPPQRGAVLKVKNKDGEEVIEAPKQSEIQEIIQTLWPKKSST
jgi:hypothetical protein